MASSQNWKEEKVYKRGKKSQKGYITQYTQIQHSTKIFQAIERTLDFIVSTIKSIEHDTVIALISHGNYSQFNLRQTELILFPIIFPKLLILSNLFMAFKKSRFCPSCTFEMLWSLLIPSSFWVLHNVQKLNQTPEYPNSKPCFEHSLNSIRQVSRPLCISAQLKIIDGFENYYL